MTDAAPTSCASSRATSAGKPEGAQFSKQSVNKIACYEVGFHPLKDHYLFLRRTCRMCSINTKKSAVGKDQVIISTEGQVLPPESFFMFTLKRISMPSPVTWNGGEKEKLDKFFSKHSLIHWQSIRNIESDSQWNTKHQGERISQWPSES